MICVDEARSNWSIPGIPKVEVEFACLIAAAAPPGSHAERQDIRALIRIESMMFPHMRVHLQNQFQRGTAPQRPIVFGRLHFAHFQ